MKITTIVLAALVSSGPSAVPEPSVPQAPVKVVTTLPIYANLVTEIGGAEVDVSFIAHPNEDAHFVRPKPSYALAIRGADMFVTTGLDLELWVPALLDRAHNTDVLEGSRGYVTTYTGITLLDIPVAADRSGGDVHIFGNPHVTTDPLRTLQVARNITTGLKRVAPDRSAIWDAGLADFADRVHRRLFGDRLVELIGGETLEQLANRGTLHDFLADNQYEGTPLLRSLGGWLGKAEAFRGGQMICYHKNWAYLEDRFAVTCADYVEAKPGISPTPGHVGQLIRRMREENIKVLLAATYFDEGKVSTVAERGRATMVRVPMSTGAVPGVDDYFSLVDTWIDGLANAFAAN